MKKTISTTTYTCDCCNKEMKEPFLGDSIVIGGDGRDVVSRLKFGVQAVFPYATEKGDICLECVCKFLQKWIDARVTRQSGDE